MDANKIYYSDGNEYVDCAAIRYDDGLIEYLSRPGRHSDIIKKVFIERGFHKKSFSQGFLTNTGRFVSRCEARLIAVDSGQIEPTKTLHKKQLFSEDLW